jgi:Ni/Co efflux regulator RcnB
MAASGSWEPSCRWNCGYYVVNPAYYGLAVAPAGHAWIYANGSIVLASRTTGVIVRTVPRVW